uniref:Major capsid protein n=1 Tax=Pithovirus LCPAC304 TaxID=2506594 RepID=A0A481Z9X8_9VIRU|nr:MAG: major capsid protein [Pithovirus LCPAC304]
MTSVAKMELNSITEFQKELHESRKNKEGVLEKIASIFYQEFEKVTWYTRILNKIPCSVVGDDNVYVFKANTTFHSLVYTYMVQHWPYIRVKPEHRGEYKICWPHNRPHNTLPNAHFEVDDVVMNTFDHVWLDTYFEHFMKPGFRDHHNMCVGNVPRDEEWGDVLYPSDTDLPQPWFYSRDPCLAFPLHYCARDTNVLHVYEVKNKIKDLLRMAKCVTDRTGKKRWVELKEVDFKMLDGVTLKSKLKKPELWAAYSYVTPNEIAWNTECQGEEDKVFYINDVVSCDQINTKTYGKTAEVDLCCTSPCKALFWSAENVDASKKRNYSNYTTDSNVYVGWDPIQHVGLKYSETQRIKEMATHHFTRMQSWYHFPSPPSTAGYSVHSLSHDCMSIDAEVGLVFSELKAKMFFKLQGRKFQGHKFQNPASQLYDFSAECDLESETSADEDEYLDTHTSTIEDASEPKYTSPNFRIHMRLLVLKKLTIEKKDKKYEFKI